MEDEKIYSMQINLVATSKDELNSLISLCYGIRGIVSVSAVLQEAEESTPLLSTKLKGAIRRRRWKDSEIKELVMEYNNGKDDKHISKVLGRPLGSVRNKLVQLRMDHAI